MQDLTTDERLALTRSVIHLLEEWGLQPRDIIHLLALPDDIKPRHLGRYKFNTPFPDNPEVMRRIEYVVKIADALRTSFPRNPQQCSRWLRQSNHRFGRQAPLAMMLEDGENGLINVLARLDCTFAWDASGSKG
ncbi:MAG TPA: DUF2384 domain-containing protein [Chromatiales bacterium]|nr:DUF2384 domain-containing protein [Chromatiales bacterium]